MREQPLANFIAAVASIASSARRAAHSLLEQRHLVVLLTTFGALNGSAPFANAAEYEAIAVKAAFLHRFSAYVAWPAPTAAHSPFTIAVMGDDSLVAHLERLLPGLTIHNRRPQVRSVSNAAELDDVQILYIGPSHAARTKAVANELRGRPVLIVTDHAEGLANGGVINFVHLARNVRFEVSLPAARRNGLQINSGLLSVAVRVEDEPRSNLDDGSRSLLVADDSTLFSFSQNDLQPPALAHKTIPARSLGARHPKQ